MAGPAELEQARKLYNQTDYELSLKLLDAQRSKTPAVHELMGRNYFMRGDFKQASEAFEKAVEAEPSNSSYAMWLGRAYGRRAETSNPLFAPGLASSAC